MKINVLRNKEVKNIIASLLIVQIIFSIIIVLVIKDSKNIILEDIVNTKAEIVGDLVESHPELENEIVKGIIKAEGENIEKGKEILKKYDYSREMNYKFEGSLATREKNLNIQLTTIIIAMTVAMILIVYLQMKKVYGKVNKAYTYVDEVLHGNEKAYLDYEGEGEFPILANELSKMVTVIKKDNEIINKEKAYLKEMLTDISHQLKTPLTSITMLTDILIDKENMDSEKRVEFLNKISAQNEKMEWLIYNLLKMARLDSGSITFEREEVLLDYVVEATIKSLEMKAKEKNININIIGEKAKFIGDSHWTIEAVTNIVKNAIEHTEPKGEITIIQEENKVFSRLTIKDTGEGISKKDLPNIFKRFYTGSKGSKSESIGVGLAMAKTIIEKQEGYVLVFTEEGIGTTFEITLVKGLSVNELSSKDITLTKQRRIKSLKGDI